MPAAPSCPRSRSPRPSCAAGGRALVLAEPGRLSAQGRRSGRRGDRLSGRHQEPGAHAGQCPRHRAAWSPSGASTSCMPAAAPRPGARCWRRGARGVPFVTTYHGAYGETNRVKRLYNSVMARGDVVIANSRYTADLIAAALRHAAPAHRRHPSRRRRRRVRSGADRARARRAPCARAGASPTRTRVILQAARLTGWKGQGVLIDAAAQLQARGQARQTPWWCWPATPRAATATCDALHTPSRAGSACERAGPPCRPCRGHGRRLSCRARDGRCLDRARGVRPGGHRGGGHGLPRHRHRHRRPAGDGAGRAGRGGREPAPAGWCRPGDAGALAERLAEALALPPAARDGHGQRARAACPGPFHRGGHAARTLGVYDRLLGTVLERTVSEASPMRHSNSLTECRATILTCACISPILCRSAASVAACLGGCRPAASCNNRWRLQHTSSNESRA